LGSLGCGAQLDTGTFNYIKRIEPKRVEIADPVTGRVFGLSQFRHPMDEKTLKITGDMIGKVRSLRELFEIELRYDYDCEQELVNKGLPMMIESANSPQLRSALEQHLTETRTRVARLRRVFSALGAEPDTKSNDILDKMMSAAKDSASNIDDSPLRDTALIVNGNYVEHYEIAMYGRLVSFARRLGPQEAVGVLEETLKEEKAADAKLTGTGETIHALSARRATA
jgi:ferritin-like metal-binding protein YciE